MKKHLLLTAGLILVTPLLLAQPAGDQGSSSGNPSDFGTYDANGDGKISRDEVKANPDLSSRFGTLDKNGDGSLSQAEYSTAFRASPKNQGGQKTDEGSDQNPDRKLPPRD